MYCNTHDILAECKRIPECLQTFTALKKAGYKVATEQFADMRIVFSDEHDCELFFSKYPGKYIDGEPVFTTNLRIVAWERTNPNVPLSKATYSDAKIILQLNVQDLTVEDIVKQIEKVKELCTL